MQSFLQTRGDEAVAVVSSPREGGLKAHGLMRWASKEQGCRE